MSDETPVRSFRRTDKPAKFDVVAAYKKLATAIPKKPQLLRPELPGCETFVEDNFRQSSLELIEHANAIIAQYSTRLTLRQLYYQFVARGIIPNSQREYSRLGDLVSRGRNNGRIPWDTIEDRTRKLQGQRCYDDSIAEYLSTVQFDYHEDPWTGQAFRAEVWIEKDALVGVIERVCSDWHVPYFSCRGYVSDSAAYAAAQRLKLAVSPVVFHLGDHDPSGIQMTGDIEHKLRLYMQSPIEVVRLALNEDQTEDLPPNVVKDSDSRSETYREDFGEDCWELDALDPALIQTLVHNAVDERIDHRAWNAAKKHEQESKEELGKLIKELREEHQHDLES